MSRHDQTHDHVAYRRERVEMCRNLQPGWFDGHGEPVSDAAIAGALTVCDDLERLAPDEHWFLGATEEGGIRFEATSGGRLDPNRDAPVRHSTTIEIEPDGYAYIHTIATDRGCDLTGSDFDDTTTADGAVAIALTLRAQVTRSVTT